MQERQSRILIASVHKVHIVQAVRVERLERVERRMKGIEGMEGMEAKKKESVRSTLCRQLAAETGTGGRSAQLVLRSKLIASLCEACNEMRVGQFLATIVY